MNHLVDTHCHIDLYPNFSELIEAVETARIYTIAVTNAPSVFRQCASLLHGKKYIRPALGLHPQLAHQRAHELPLALELLTETRYVGEIGLDFMTTDRDDRASQLKVFRAITDSCAGYGDKILTVHSRRATQEVVETLGDSYPGIVILHWYSGSLRLLERALSYGFYFSVNPAMLKTEKGRRIVCAIPTERLLTESDGPFVETMGRPANPHDIAEVTVELAQLSGLAMDQMRRILFSNFRALLG
jgi:TatD DNase family protein